MAKRTVTTLVDDLDGNSTAEENVSFGLDRVDYEIDLSADHAGALREVLAPYLSAARRTGGRRGSRGSQPTRPAKSVAEGGSARSRSTNAEIRAWAASHGVTLAERGRFPGQVIEAFETGDPSRLPGSGDSGSATDAHTPAASVVPTSDPEASPEPPVSNDPPRGRDGLTTAERDAVRAWAMEQGIEVKTRGQLKKDLVANYQAWQHRQ